MDARSTRYRVNPYGNVIDGHQSYENSKNNNEQTTSKDDNNIASNVDANKVKNKTDEKVTDVNESSKERGESQRMLWCIRLQPKMIYPSFP